MALGRAAAVPVTVLLVLAICCTHQAAASRVLTSRSAVEPHSGAHWRKLAQNLGAAVAASGAENGGSTELLSEVTPAVQHSGGSAALVQSDSLANADQYFAFGGVDDAESQEDLLDDDAESDFFSQSSFGTEQAGFAAQADSEPVLTQAVVGAQQSEVSMLRGTTMRRRLL